MPRVSVSDRATAGVLALALGLSVAVPAIGQPVVQPIPSSDSRTLNAALARVAANPRDSGALVDAGNAALAMNDVEAAIGFFTRAQQVAPNDPRPKAGLAGAYVRNEDPFTAIRLFNEAERDGPLPNTLLADRGLAYDLVGDNATAQRYYRQAAPGDDEAARRLALSLAISGDKRGSEAALSPLLARQDKSASRVRAFSLAILGEEAQAVQIANATMPATLASAMTPYLRYMRQLTRAQQAAAANLGHFPRASEIGRDDPRMAQYSPPSSQRPATGVDAGLVPAGKPLGGATTATGRARGTLQASRQERLARAQRDERRRNQARQSRERERPPEPVVAVTTATPPPSALAAASRPTPRSSARPSAPPPTARPGSPPVAASPPSPPPAPAAPPPATPPVPGFGLASAAPPPAAAPSASTPLSAAAAGPSFSLAPGASTPAAPAAAAAPPPSPPPAPPPRPRSLAEAFGDLGQPSTSITPAAGAVDIRRIAPARPAEVKQPVKPAPPAQPSRIWVQVATGRNKQALGFDWWRMARENATVFRGKNPFVAAWGQTNRLLTGPFETEASANAFIAQLRRASVDGAFLWTSPAGQVVDALVAGK